MIWRKLPSLFFLNLYCAITAISVLRVPTPPVTGWAFNTLQILSVALLLTSLYAVIRVYRDGDWAFDPIDDLLLPLALAGIAAWLRFRFISHYDLWLDEDIQIFSSLHVKDLYLDASYHNFPPANYYQMKFVMEAFGASLFSARFLSALFGSLAVWPLFTALRSFASREIALLGALLFAGSDIALSYSQEGRAYMPGCFLFVLYLKFWLDAAGPKSRVVDWICLVVTQVLLAITISMQPHMMFGLQGLVLFAFFRFRQPAKNFFAATTMGFLLALPVLYFPFALLHEDDYTFRTQSDFLTRHWDFFLPALRETLGNLLWAYPLLLIAAFVAWKRDKQTWREPGFGLLALTIIFPWPAYAAFQLVLDQPIFGRYILFYLPLFLLAMAYAFQILIPQKLFLRIALAITILGFAFQAKATIKYQEPIWEAFFTYVGQREKEKGIAITMDLQEEPLKFAREGFVGVDIYYTPTLRERISLHEGPEPELSFQGDLVQRLSQNPQARYLYAIVPKRTGNLLAQAKVEKVEMIELEPNNLVWRIEGGADLPRAVDEFFDRLGKENPAIGSHYRHRATLAGLAALRGNCPRARDLWAAVQRPEKDRRHAMSSFVFLEAFLKQKCGDQRKLTK